MRIYYIDEALNEEELNFVKESIANRESLKSIQSIEQIRVPCILPPFNKNGQLCQNIEKQIELIKKNLINSGINSDQGAQVIWVMPKETHLGVKFQMAIMELTGFAPYVVQRWFINEKEETVRGNLRVIDGHGMLGGGKD